jgi:DNA adenine methylase
VLLGKPRVYAEVYNDLDREISNLFQVCRDRGDEIVRALELTPYSRADFELSFLPASDPVEQARRTFVRSFMGFGGNLTRPNRDQTPQRTGFRRYSSTSRRSTPAGDWVNFPPALREIIERLRGVFIETRDARKVLVEHDGPDTLHYSDPPYVHSTRGFTCGGAKGGGSHRGYRFEMTDNDHRDLAAAHHALSGMVVISGYACDLYDRELYSDWERHERLHVADGARPRVEVLWLNPACSEALRANRSQATLELGQ